jgi:hypothetical protein
MEYKGMNDPQNTNETLSYADMIYVINDEEKSIVEVAQELGGVIVKEYEYENIQ